MNQVKVSEIRAKFPMYGDKTDEELLIAVRKKFYPEMPIGEFVKRVDFDTARKRLMDDQLEQMGGIGRFVAGYGKSGVDLARGLGQWVGLTSREDVAESRKLDAPLMESTEGRAGNITGSVANALPLAFAPGANTLAGAAAYGALTGAASTSESTDETLKNVGIGTGLGPLAILAGRGLAAGYQGIKGLVDPLTKSGQERIAADTLKRFATDPTKAAANLQSAQELVKGSKPTLAQASRDPGLAQLERTLVNNPETGGQLMTRFADQRAARLAAIKDVAGSDEHYDAIMEGRKLFANEDYGRAIVEGVDSEAAKMLKPQIESLMRRPSIQQAKQAALKLAREQDHNITDFGSIEGLDWLKKGLDDVISRASNPVNSAGKQSLSSMLKTKEELMSVIETVAPAYKTANDNFAAMSRQINAMDVGRELLKRYEKPLARFGANTREMSDAYAAAFEGAVESTKKATGMDVPLSKFMPPSEIKKLEGVARDLGRKVAAEELGKGVGSNTAQNLASQNLLRRALGPTGLPQKWSESTALQTLLSPVGGLYKLGGAEQRIMERLAQAALDPADAALLLTSKNPDKLLKLARRSESFLPGLPLSGLLSQSPQ